MENNKKLQNYYENPIDNIIINNCDKLIDILSNNNITPNTVTIVRLILICIVLYLLLYKSNVCFPIIGIIMFYLISYLGRSTDQISLFNNYLNNFNDLFFYIIFILYIYTKDYDNKYNIFIIFIIFMYLLLVHLGLRQLNYKLLINDTNNNNIEEQLFDNLNKLHNLNSSNIKWTKYFGNGTFIIVILIITYYIQTHLNINMMPIIC